MVFAEYPCTDYKTEKNRLAFSAKSDPNLTFRMAVISLEEQPLPQIEVFETLQHRSLVAPKKETGHLFIEYKLAGNSKISIKWK